MYDNIIMSNNNKMESLKLLLSKDTSTTKPKLIKRSGLFTNKFLSWNLQQLKQGKTTLYADNTKYYDPREGKQNIKNIPRDKRYKKFTPKPSFLSKNVKVGSSYAPQSFFNSIKNKSEEFSYELNNNNTSYSYDEEIENNLLLKVLIDKYSISGNYRIIINGSVDGNLIDNNYNIDNDFWKEYGTDFFKDSENMIWNDPSLATPQTITFIFSKETKLNYKFFDQAFLDGVSHCFFTPILQHFTNIIDGTKAKATKKKYQGLVNKIQGKQLKNEFKEGYLHKYANGIKRNDICYVCEDLQIEVAIEQPFNTEPLFEYRSNKKPLKKFKFLNTRSDHVEYATNNDLFKQYEPVKISQKEMIKLKEELDKDKIFNTYKKNAYGICNLNTLDNYYVLDDEFYNCVKDFEKDTVLENCAIDALKYPELQSFIDAGTHFNGTIDFVDTEELKKKIPEEIKHIDMTKAYTCFEQSKYYNGFMGHITDFREVDNYDQKGLYRIVDLNYTKCSEQFIMLNVMLSWFHNDNIYTDAELRALTEQKASFKITHGAFGTGFNMKLSNDMINKKVLVKQLDSGEDIKIPYYCKYFGMISMTGKTKKFYMDGDQKYFKSMNNENADIYYENNTAKIIYSKKYCFNKKHITAQITAYQRLIMLEQLLQMDFEKLVRVCVDGIYYKEHSINLHKSFSYKTKMTFNNSPCEEYLSGILSDNQFNYSLPKAKPRKFYKTELFDGEGGLGKTYHNIFMDKGLIDVCYIPHSWKLSTAQTKQLEREQEEKLQSSVHFHIFNKDIVGYDVLSKYSVVLLDECSMITEQQKQCIIKNTQGKVIFMGDIDMQLAPCEGEQMNRKGIDKITRLKKNWRFKDNKMIALNNLLRKNGDKKYIDYFSLGIKTITKAELKKQYKPEDIILNYYKDNKYGEMFKDIQKFKITSNTRDYKNGEIVFDKDVKSKKEFRHGYTIHSVQGETFDKNIYIDIKSRKGKTLMQNRLFYTAISRARYFDQIHLIVEDKKGSIKDLKSTFVNDLEFVGIDEETTKILKKKIDFKKQFEQDLKDIGFKK